MVKNIESLFIQRVEPKDAFEDTITSELELYGICVVDHIDWFKKIDITGNSYFSAYIYIEKMIDNTSSWREHLSSNGVQFGKWFVITNQYVPTQELIDKENIVYLKDRINYLNKKMLQMNDILHKFMKNETNKEAMTVPIP